MARPTTMGFAWKLLRHAIGVEDVTCLPRLLSPRLAWGTAFWDFARRLGRSLVIHRKTPNVRAVAK
jgi:hypothetical protein